MFSKENHLLKKSNLHNYFFWQSHRTKFCPLYQVPRNNKKNLLKINYTLRIDLHKRMIEHAEISQVEQDHYPSPPKQQHLHDEPEMMPPAKKND